MVNPKLAWDYDSGYDLVIIKNLQSLQHSDFEVNQICKHEKRGLLPDTQNCSLRMRRECRERFPRHRRQRKTLVSDPGMHHGTCVTHVPWCMSWSLTRGGGGNVPGITGACATRNFAYLSRGPWEVFSIHLWVWLNLSCFMSRGAYKKKKTVKGLYMVVLC